jgi:hypothetical protein
MGDCQGGDRVSTLTLMNTSEKLPAGQAERRCDTRAVRSTRMAIGPGVWGHRRTHFHFRTGPHGQITKGEMSLSPR